MLTEHIPLAGIELPQVLPTSRNGGATVMLLMAIAVVADGLIIVSVCGELVSPTMMSPKLSIFFGWNFSVALANATPGAAPISAIGKIAASKERSESAGTQRSVREGNSRRSGSIILSIHRSIGADHYASHGEALDKIRVRGRICSQ